MLSLSLSVSLSLEELDFSLSKKEVLETKEECLNKNRTISSKEIIPGDEVFMKLKKNTSVKFERSIKH